MENWIRFAVTIRALRTRLHRFEFMTEQINLPPQPEGERGNPVATLFWLIVAFIPGLVSLLLFETKNPSRWSLQALLFLAAACCLCSGFGVVARVKDVAVRILLGLILAAVFFALNVFVVIFVGCSGLRGSIAP